MLSFSCPGASISVSNVMRRSVSTVPAIWTSSRCVPPSSATSTAYVDEGAGSGAEACTVTGIPSNLGVLSLYAARASRRSYTTTSFAAPKPPWLTVSSQAIVLLFSGVPRLLNEYFGTVAVPVAPGSPVTCIDEPAGDDIVAVFERS